VLLAVPALAIVVGERQQSAWRRSLLRLLPLLWTVPSVALAWEWTVAYGAAVAIVWWLLRGTPPGPAAAIPGDASRSAAPP
jgi:hypothetical protein